MQLAIRNGDPVDPPTGIRELTDAQRQGVRARYIDRSARRPPPLAPSPPEAQAGEERVKRHRERLADVSRLDLLRRFWQRAGRRGELAREPIPRRS